jgi:hypothetical protein
VVGLLATQVYTVLVRTPPPPQCNCLFSVKTTEGSRAVRKPCSRCIVSALSETHCTWTKQMLRTCRQLCGAQP